jgi:hypothetical protein
MMPLAAPLFGVYYLVPQKLGVLPPLERERNSVLERSCAITRELFLQIRAYFRSIN